MKKLFMEIKSQKLIEENGNTRIYFSEVAWGDKPAKKEIRKWLTKEDGSIAALKGVTFKDDTSLDKLAEILVEDGYGDKEVLLSKLNSRTERKKEEEKEYVSTEDILDSIRKDDK